jgi:hypothetical protein
MPYAKKEMERDLAHVYRNISEILTAAVDPNVLQIQIAIAAELASIISVSILVRELVE